MWGMSVLLGLKWERSHDCSALHKKTTVTARWKMWLTFTQVVWQTPKYRVFFLLALCDCRATFEKTEQETIAQCQNAIFCFTCKEIFFVVVVFINKCNEKTKIYYIWPCYQAYSKLPWSQNWCLSVYITYVLIYMAQIFSFLSERSQETENIHM